MSTIHRFYYLVVFSEHSMIYSNDMWKVSDTLPVQHWKLSNVWLFHTVTDTISYQCATTLFGWAWFPFYYESSSVPLWWCPPALCSMWWISLQIIRTIYFLEWPGHLYLQPLVCRRRVIHRVSWLVHSLRLSRIHTTSTDIFARSSTQGNNSRYRIYVQHVTCLPPLIERHVPCYLCTLYVTMMILCKCFIAHGVTDTESFTLKYMSNWRYTTRWVLLLLCFLCSPISTIRQDSREDRLPKISNARFIGVGHGSTMRVMIPRTRHAFKTVRAHARIATVATSQVKMTFSSTEICQSRSVVRSCTYPVVPCHMPWWRHSLQPCTCCGLIALACAVFV